MITLQLHCNKSIIGEMVCFFFYIISICLPSKQQKGALSLIRKIYTYTMFCSLRVSWIVVFVERVVAG